eukprot:366242-Chlamydomonas_euryale.AAC.12
MHGTIPMWCTTSGTAFTKTLKFECLNLTAGEMPNDGYGAWLGRIYGILFKTKSKGCSSETLCVVVGMHRHGTEGWRAVQLQSLQDMVLACK